MIPSPVCILYSQDTDLVRRVKAFLSALAQVRHVSSPDRLDAVLQQNSPAILVLDLRAKEARELLEQIQAALPEILVVALGTLRSEPLREVDQLIKEGFTHVVDADLASYFGAPGDRQEIDGASPLR